MKVLWFTWKDLSHPWAGGAELVNERLAERMVADGHEVTLLVGGYKGCKPVEMVNGYKVIRVGGFYSVFWHTFRYYRRHLREWPDMVIEEVNTLPFFTRFYVKQPSALFFHQLCRKVWFYQMKQPFSLVGYLAEPLYLRLLRGKKLMTISESSRQDLINHGFKREDISVMRLGFDMKPLTKVKFSDKYAAPTLLSLGTIRPMKQTLEQIKAFELAKRHMPDLRLKIAGGIGGAYGKAVLDYIAASKYTADIQYLGRVSSSQRQELTRRSHLLLATSIKEGWGLTVTEAASQGTPAVVYDVDGLRDSTHYGQTGTIAAHNSPLGLSEAILTTLQNKQAYKDLCHKALETNRRYSFNQSYQDFKTLLDRTPSAAPNTQLVLESAGGAAPAP
jgi:glycosyltransferase involved in cell wall biosynthesis